MTYQVPANTTAIDVGPEFKFSKNQFVLNTIDKESIDYIMLPEGFIKSRAEALAF